MNYFASNRFVLSTESARALYEGCKAIPVFDFHNHLSPKLLYENSHYRSIADFWLSGDHYIWRAMRLAGVEEHLITGDAPDREKFLAWVTVLDGLVGCPLYAWTQMQMAVVFCEEHPLTTENAAEVYERCNTLLQTDEFLPRSLLKRFGVSSLCTTDEPFDSLEWHSLLQKEVSDLLVLPAFRPDKLIAITKSDWLPSIAKLEQSEGCTISTMDDLKSALRHSLDRFLELGCRTADHGYEGLKFTDTAGAEEAFDLALAGKRLTSQQADAFSSAMLQFLGELYSEKNIVMQLHIGALRNGNSRRFELLGADCGVDSVDDSPGIRPTARLLDTLEREGKLPRTILYCLDESDYSKLATLCASFASAGVRNKVQLGAAWWFNDHERGMRLHLTSLMENGLLPGFVGMLTDSRSIGSFVRHDYFRRVLCDSIGDFVERGEYPLRSAQRIVNDICYQNAVTYFGG